MKWKEKASVNTWDSIRRGVWWVMIYYRLISRYCRKHTHPHLQTLTEQLDTRLVKHCVLMNSGSPAAVKAAHTELCVRAHTHKCTNTHLQEHNTFIWWNCLHQGRDICSWRSPARGSISGPHSRRGAPGHVEALEMLSCFPGSWSRNGRAVYGIASSKQTDANLRMEWRTHTGMCVSVCEDVRNFYVPGEVPPT